MESLVPAAFFTFIALHIAFGSVGLVAFWVPVIGRKGGAAHKRWGKVFTWTMLATGTAAIGISLCTLIDPIGTHPHLVEAGPQWIRGIFGWMMQGLAVLTINLAWYGHSCLVNRQDHRRNLEWRNLGLQVLLLAVSLNCIWQSLRIGHLGDTIGKHATEVGGGSRRLGARRRHYHDRESDRRP